MDSAWLVTSTRKRLENWAVARQQRRRYDIADNSQLAFAMYLLGHTEGSPYALVYVDRTVKGRAFRDLRRRIAEVERRKNWPPVRLARQAFFDGILDSLAFAVMHG